MNSSDPLDDSEGIPRQVVVYYQIAELKIDALASRFGRNQTAARWIVTEALDDLFASICSHATHDGDHGVVAKLRF